MTCFCADHSCNFPGCSSVIVIDGNLKNRRDICASTSAGYLSFNGLPDIKTGCQSTPARQSKFCYDHAPRKCKIPSNASEELSSEHAVQIVTAKKQTRGGIYYQVSEDIFTRLVRLEYVHGL